MKGKITLAILILTVLFSSVIYAQGDGTVIVHYFWGDGCPHCEDAKPFLEGLEEQYPLLVINRYETWNNRSNAELLTSMSSACGTGVVGVPTFFVGHKPVVGFSESKSREIEEAIINYDGVNLIDHIGENITSCPTNGNSVLELPWFGEVDVTHISLPLLTIVIGALDGFNPCAMWVLLFLLTLLVYTKSRKKMFIIGGVFILVSGLVYYVFMAAWLNLFIFIGIMSGLRLVVGIIAILAASINIKDFFAFKKGISLSIPERAKPGLFKRMRGIVQGKSLLTMVLGVMVLAFTVNLIELLCTAGFPAIYTKILTLNSLSPMKYYLYLLLYIAVYMLDDFIIFIVAVMTLSSKKLTEKHGRVLKLISGVMMLILGLIIILKPELLMFG